MVDTRFGRAQDKIIFRRILIFFAEAQRQKQGAAHDHDPGHIISRIQIVQAEIRFKIGI